MLIESFLQGQRNVIKVFDIEANTDHDNCIEKYFGRFSVKVDRLGKITICHHFKVNFQCQQS